MNKLRNEIRGELEEIDQQLNPFSSYVQVFGNESLVSS
jgi:hypothetical protein